MLTGRKRQAGVLAWRRRMTELLRNLLLLERPVQDITLSSTLKAAVRARRRQYEVQEHIAAREQTATDLETLVAARTQALEQRTRELGAQIAERKRAEAAAQATDQQFGILVQGVTDYAIFMLDPDGYITSWNRGAERIKGYTTREILGQHFSRFYSYEDRSSGVPAQALATARREGKCEKEGWRFRKDGSRFWAHVVIDPIWAENGTLLGYAKVTRDVTDGREAQRALDEAKEQLLQSQKMEAVGQLTGGLAHDFNNLLTAITGSLEVLETRLKQGRTAEVGRFIETAIGAAERAANLTHRLLAFSRRQALDPQPLVVNRLVAGMEDLIRRTTGPEAVLQMVLADDLWPTLCDPGQLETAVLNLAINARDAMPGGGHLRIETANAQLEGAQADDVKAGEYVSVSVIDTGAGMPASVIARAFEPFFTTKPLGVGTGLGLSMVYGFVKQSGGHVRIFSEVGQGTTVKLYLPRYTGQVTTMNRSDRLCDAPMPAEPGETVLVVDDEPAVRMVVGEVLRELGYNILEAENGPAALDTLNSRARVDLLITDVGMPGGMNGRQLADAAHVFRRELGVLFITGYAESAAIGEGVLPIGMEVMTKPFSKEGLAAKVNAMLIDVRSATAASPVDSLE
ncbi:MAG: PAS domain S-box protein [Acetobacteraceae bacterium]|nr:PAS domain S-box protein [Acetobacteraceae bacterium]